MVDSRKVRLLVPLLVCVGCGGSREPAASRPTFRVAAASDLQAAAMAIYDAVQVDDTARAAWLTLMISAVSVIVLVIVQKGSPIVG